MKKEDVPKKGWLIRAAYYLNGQKKKMVDLGDVKAADTKGYTDGDGVARTYNFDTHNGIRLLGFEKPKK